MKKIFILAAALATLASCTKNASLEVAPAAEDEAIGFSAYSGTAATKGTVVETTDVIATDKGIGVFAFYQPATNKTPNKFNSTKFASPDFMYDTQVKPDGMKSVLYANVTEYNAAKGTSLTEAEFDALSVAQKTKYYTADDWIYSPKKYWPNNTGDLISFFAYAPYDENKTWEDLGFKTDVNATKLTASFPVYTEKTAMEDYVFATPALNKSKQNIGGAKINFDFKHIMSRVAINIGAIIDATGTSPAAFPQPDAAGTGTIITVESIEFQNIAESYDYTYTIETGKESWKENGSQNLLLSAKAGDFQNNTSASWTEAKWKNLLKDEKGKTAYLFIAPQDLTNANLVITYTVETKNAKNPADNSTIKNVITKPVNVNFLSGKAYVLNLLIGMKTVELSATVKDWDETTPAQINDAPANVTELSYFDNGIYCGEGIEIDFGGTIGKMVWAPVNCGYTSSQYPYGKLYQWGRKYGQGYTGEPYEPKGDNLVNISSAALTSHPDGDTYNGKFYWGNIDWYNGSSPTADKLWTEDGSTKYNPCPDGWRVPTKDELTALVGSHTSGALQDGASGTIYEGMKGKYFDGSATVEPTGGVFLPAAGYRGNITSPAVLGRSFAGYYWSSSAESTGSVRLLFKDTQNSSFEQFDRAKGLSVRCVQIKKK